MRKLALKNPNLKVALNGEALVVEEGGLARVFGLRYFDRVLINKAIELSLDDLFALSKSVEVFLIDSNGNALGRFERLKL